MAITCPLVAQDRNQPYLRFISVTSLQHLPVYLLFSHLPTLSMVSSPQGSHLVPQSWIPATPVPISPTQLDPIIPYLLLM